MRHATYASSQAARQLARALLCAIMICLGAPHDGRAQTTGGTTGGTTGSATDAIAPRGTPQADEAKKKYGIQVVKPAGKFDQDVIEMIKNGTFADVPITDKPITARPVAAKVVEEAWGAVDAKLRAGARPRDEIKPLVAALASRGLRDDTTRALAGAEIVREQLRAKKMTAQVASDALDDLQAIAPDLPDLQLIRAGLVARHDPAQLVTAAQAWSRAQPLLWAWPDAGLPLRYTIIWTLLLAIAASAVVFVLAQVQRNLGVAAHDLTRVLPRGMSDRQALVALTLAVALPSLLLGSPLLALMIALAIVACVQQPGERLVTLLLWLTLLALPSTERVLADHLTYTDSLAARLQRAQYGGCDRPCVAAIDAAREAEEDPTLRAEAAYTLMLAHMRQGDLKRARRAMPLKGVLDEEAARKLSPELRGRALNAHAAMLLVGERPAATQAVELLGRAVKLTPESAAPHYNTMRAYQALNKKPLVDAALAEASKREPVRVSVAGRLDRRDLSSALMLDPAPLDTFWRLHVSARRQSTRPAPSPLRPAWRRALGSLPLGAVGGLGLLGFALSMLTLGAVLVRNTSTPCPRCGMARDPHDGALNGDHPECHNCYTTFVAGSLLDHQTRAANEAFLGRRIWLRHLLRRVGAIVAPGSGYIMAGYALTGWLMTLCAAFALLWLIPPPGLTWRSPTSMLGAPTGALVVIVLLGVVIVPLSISAAARELADARLKTRRHVGARTRPKDQHDNRPPHLRDAR